MTCECGDTGYLLDQTYGYTEIPRGAVPVQRCDLCRKFESDLEAAIAAALNLDTSFGANFAPTVTINSGIDQLEIAGESLDRWGNHCGPIGQREGFDPDAGLGDCWVWLPPNHAILLADECNAPMPKGR